MFIIPIYLFSEIFPVHQGPFTSLAATENHEHCRGYYYYYYHLHVTLTFSRHGLHVFDYGHAAFQQNNEARASWSYHSAFCSTNVRISLLCAAVHNKQYQQSKSATVLRGVGP